jgi:hypothetical protein
MSVIRGFLLSSILRLHLTCQTIHTLVLILLYHHSRFVVLCSISGSLLYSIWVPAMVIGDRPLSENIHTMWVHTEFNFFKIKVDPTMIIILQEFVKTFGTWVLGMAHVLSYKYR